MYKKKNISCVSVRAGNVIGGGDWTANRIVPDFFKSVKKRQKIVLRNPKSNRPWQHVMEPLAVYLFLGLILNKNKNKINGESFNIGPNAKNNASVLTLIKKIINKCGQKINISRENKNLFAETKKLNLNTNKIFKSIGWKNKLNFDQTCSFITEWYKKYDKDKSSVFDITSKQIMEYIKLK